MLFIENVLGVRGGKVWHGVIQNPLLGTLLKQGGKETEFECKLGSVFLSENAETLLDVLPIHCEGES